MPTLEGNRIAEAREAVRQISSPWDLATLLLAVADDCDEAADNVGAAWQESQPMRPWRELARSLRSRTVIRLSKEA